MPPFARSSKYLNPSSVSVPSCVYANVPIGDILIRFFIITLLISIGSHRIL